jgi:hypothetical protein
VLVARTEWDTHPSLAERLPHENALSPSVEWLASLEPDLVVAWPDRDARTVITRLEQLGIPVYASAVETLAGIDSSIARFGILLGRERRADSLRRRVRGQLDSVRRAVAGAARPGVLYALSFDPPMAASNATYLGELVELAGGRNIFADLTTLWPQVTGGDRAAPARGSSSGRSGYVDDVVSTLRRPPARSPPSGRRVHAVDVNLSPAGRARVDAALQLRAIHPGERHGIPRPARRRKRRARNGGDGRRQREAGAPHLAGRDAATADQLEPTPWLSRPAACSSSCCRGGAAAERR